MAEVLLIGVLLYVGWCGGRVTRERKLDGRR